MAVLVRVFCAHHLPLQLPSKQFLQASSPCKQAVLADSDGWLHSGDVGELIPSGALKIIDRIKNIFKLAHGEYIAAEKLENQYKKCTLIDQIWVYGDSESSYLVAVVVPQASNLGAWARESGLPSDIQALCKEERAARHVQSLLESEGRSAGLKGFEIVKMVHLSPNPFSVENGLQTPSFKLKRSELKKNFTEEIKQMYSLLKS